MSDEFDDQREALEELLKRYRPKWQLSALAWMDYDDVCQIIRLHIFDDCIQSDKESDQE